MFEFGGPHHSTIVTVCDLLMKSMNTLIAQTTQYDDCHYNHNGSQIGGRGGRVWTHAESMRPVPGMRSKVIRTEFEQIP